MLKFFFATLIIFTGCKWRGDKKSNSPVVGTNTPPAGPRDIPLRIDVLWKPINPSQTSPPDWLLGAKINLDWGEAKQTWSWSPQNVFTGTAAKLRVGENLDFFASVLGRSGQMLFEKDFLKVTIPANGDLRFSLTLSEDEIVKQLSDKDPPSPGGSGILQISDVRSESFRLTFIPARDDQTPSAELRYAIFLAESSEAIGSFDAALGKAKRLQNWSSSISSLAIKDLNPQKTYFVSVFVKDRAGNIASYEPTQQRPINDPLPPTISQRDLKISELTDGSAVISWIAASDNQSAISPVQYQVFAILGNDEFPLTSRSISGLRYRVGGLNPETRYNIRVYALDGARNKSSYAPFSFTTPRGNGSLSHAEYARQCALRLGQLKPMNCLDGQLIPITVNGTPIPSNVAPSAFSNYRFGNQMNPQTCDKPTFLELGEQGQCIPYARVLRVSSFRPDGRKDPDVESLLLCRRYIARLGQHRWQGQSYDGSVYPGFEDIAIIQHNRRTGETCWFQALAPFGDTKDGRRVPPPDEANLPQGVAPTAERSDNFWLSPPEAAKRDCVKCHDSDPWFHSPYIDQVKIGDGSPVVFAGNKEGNRTGRYSMIGNRHFTEWTLPQSLKSSPAANGASCTNCHEIGNRESCARWIAYSVARLYPLHLSPFGQATFELSRWMPPSTSGSGNSLDSWQKRGWRDASENMLNCCLSPNAPGCSASPLVSPPPPYGLN